MIEKIEKVICQVVAIICGIGTIVAVAGGGRYPKIDAAFVWLGSYLLATGVVKAAFAVYAIIGSKLKNR